ncbi:YitT family protein [Xylocopilactobacillus apicola]|uniref:Membrane protein n=1 Tax=Xylocopilactobacillus apicola TaxID=2932184 RepID=A0AAU9D8R2_9LACO|nr:YitT family protein [Xylocopilactobacillus apicola]BDR58781.1 membrane protein [Xylocopilactobacillus apicola]
MKKLQVLNKNFFTQLIVICVAIEIISISINFFYAPINIAAGGATGISILASAAFGWNRSIVVLIINTLMIILAACFLGRKVVMKIAIGSFLLPLFMYLTPSFKVVEDNVLAMVIGGAVFGFGVALLYHVDASSGGTAVPPLILKKYFHINPSVTLLVIDTAVTVFNIFVDGTNAFFLATFSLVITSIVMNYIMLGFDHKIMLNIMSEEHLEDIKQVIDEASEQGYTIFDVRGGKNGENKEMLMVVTSNIDYPDLVSEILTVDKKAFMVTYNISEVRNGVFNSI